jgi:response regulator RpfG family c-di-GMP phosphodiesterase
MNGLPGSYRLTAVTEELLLPVPETYGAGPLGVDGTLPMLSEIGLLSILLLAIVFAAILLLTFNRFRATRRELARVNHLLQGQFNGVIAALLNLVHVSDASLHAHVQRHADLAKRTAERLGMSRREAEEVLWAASLHDIGKLALDRELFSAPRPLTPEEWEAVRQHPVLGATIIAAVPGLERVATYVRHHHERWDGSGYPEGLRGTEIPVGARIINVIDSFDAMIGPRPYQRPLSPAEAVAEIEERTGAQFDPEVVTAFLEELDARGVALRRRGRRGAESEIRAASRAS